MSVNQGVYIAYVQDPDQMLRQPVVELEANCMDVSLDTANRLTV